MRVVINTATATGWVFLALGAAYWWRRNARERDL